MDRKKVLIVDDEENVCLFMKDIFERSGLKAFTALSGEDAMATFSKQKPEVCIIDIHMPFSEFDGMEVLRRVKDINQKTVCVVISRIDDKEKIKKAMLLGTEQYLLKPVSVEEIKDLIEHLRAVSVS
ncbi:MAG: response regulator [Candidatus Omnitrophota bacterium]